ncbi:MAG TPA: Uma2 family endonuclease [Pirellulales bacterium]|jgi:Uma2 family endonuclease|nr:Uma2 family endonuclease [Pirellulales bacterium]
MATKVPATIDDLYRVRGKAELINGEIVMMSPTGGLPGYAGTEILTSLREYAKKTGRGYAIGDNIAFVVDLPNRQSFCPDVVFHPGPLTMKFLDGAPLLAIEVRSEGDYGPAAERQMAAKRADYFGAGTQVVWDVDLLHDERIRVYRAAAPTEPTVYRPGQTAEAEPALPGWMFTVDKLLP